MRLLVSVATATEAMAALEGGADVIDAKDPSAGALGAVSIETLRSIHAAVAGRRLVTAALGDATDEAESESAAGAFAAAGAHLVKLGFAGTTNADRVAALIAAAVRGVQSTRGQSVGVIAVAYADANRANSLQPAAVVGEASRAGATGVLLDTADKNGPGLRRLFSVEALTEWVDRAHRAGLLVALAGRLTAADLELVRDAGADIAGIRGAACDGGREGTVTADRVSVLSNKVRLLTDTTAPPVVTAFRLPSGGPNTLGDPIGGNDERCNPGGTHTIEVRIERRNPTRTRWFDDHQALRADLARDPG